MRAFALMALVLVACGSKPTPMNDAGPMNEDAGADAGVDAGRPRGDDPPSGWTVALPYPADAGVSARFGVGASLALDQYGQPMIAALVVDPNSDGVQADNRLVFTRWDGVARAWQAPITLEVVGSVDVNNPGRPVSLARNPGSGVIGVAYLNESGVVRYAHSEDEGAHFSLETVSAAVSDSSVLSNPVIAYAGDVLHLAYDARPTCGAGACGKIIHRQRTGSGAFADDEVQGSLKARDWPFAMALTASGEPAFAFFSDDTAGAVTLSYVSAGSTQTIASSTVLVDAVAKTPSVSLTLEGGTPRVAFHLLSATEADAQLWFSEKGASDWSAPVALPRNGPVGMLDSTQWYQAIVFDGSKVDVVANFARAGTVGQQCGGPKLYRTAPGGTWGQPCHPLEAGGVTVHALNQGGSWVSMAAHKPGKLTIALDYEQRGNPTIGGGVIVYREP
ncbi:MAG: hypothetical protein IPJ65_09875 [Archangiaceae bacterium]|nr:hypothetical protein [Archangiaceae bacterium]